MDKAFSSAFTSAISTKLKCEKESENECLTLSLSALTLFCDPGEELATQEQVKSERRTGSDGGERMMCFIGIIS